MCEAIFLIDSACLNLLYHIHHKFPTIFRKYSRHILLHSYKKPVILSLNLTIHRILKRGLKMKKLIIYANSFLRQADWKDLAMIKCCLCAVGIILGVLLSKKHKAFAWVVSLIVFFVTWVPLMKKFFHVVMTTDIPNE